MRIRHDLASLEWTLTGWHPHVWRWAGAGQASLNAHKGRDVGPVAVKVPGSVQNALKEAGILPDWNVKLNSRQCEWVENRHWVFEAKLPAEWVAAPGRKVLICKGLDYQGCVRINGKDAGTFKGSQVPYEFDITDLLAGGENVLGIVFTENPRQLGQINYTSQIREWKPRFNYIWDWVPRLVQVGIWDDVCLEIRDGDAIESVSFFTDYDLKSGLGSLTLSADLALEAGREVEVEVGQDAGALVRRFKAEARLKIKAEGIQVSPWQPNGNGEQMLYGVKVRLLDSQGRVLDEKESRTGFRSIRWKPCEGAAAGAEPWLCEVNGIDTFLQGVNFPPLLPNFADATEADYRKRIGVYRDCGINLFRVWGGAYLEKECFYRLCDEMGIMVWQEFPLSSSGLDNWPPEDEAAISELASIAESYIRRRQHHPSLIIWSGGNELLGGADGGKIGMERPCDASHPLLARFAEVVKQNDPARKYVPTSPSGPRCGASQSEFGKGVHHDVHGPWNHAGSLDSWYAYWDGDDALFRSESGMPGASSAEIIRKYGGEMAMTPDSDNAFWKHTLGWWIQWPDYLREGGNPDSLEEFVRWSQKRQADALSYAARACKERFPRCGGFMLWSGHDCYPCPANCAVMDFNGEPKPALLALADIFRKKGGRFAPPCG
ncbi:MAG TPA: glycoside hydrolase family 2 TIM barrel-domain containing protein [Candidatus Brocadiia bacterium]|nr:glycoside hydrolase family 2 TIM barrel-domain containing protein [Candidatus Brocadiia bacterium]